MNTRVSLNKGDIFTLPLKEGGYAVGLVSRVKKVEGQKQSSVFLGGASRNQLPCLDQLQFLEPNNAVLLARFGDLGFHDGS